MKYTRSTLKNHTTIFALIASSFAWGCSGNTTGLPDDSTEKDDSSSSSGAGYGGESSTKGGAGKSVAKGDGGAGKGASDDDGVDDRVKILSSYPADGDVGILPDAALTIAFSEAMDPESTEAAYSSSTLPSEDITFEWNDDYTELTLVPNEKLSYVEGLDDNAIAYDFSISAEAQSEAGMKITDGLSVEFQTARRQEQHISAVGKLSGSVLSNLDHQFIIAAGDTTQPTEVGMAYIVGMCTFDLDELPTDVVAFSEVRLRADHALAGGDPYGAFTSLDIYDAAFMEATWDDVVEDMGTPFRNLTNAGAASINVTVTEQVTTDYNTENFAQFAFRFEGTTNDDGTADAIWLLEPELSLQYWVP